VHKEEDAHYKNLQGQQLAMQSVESVRLRLKSWVCKEKSLNDTGKKPWVKSWKSKLVGLGLFSHSAITLGV
jgi:hypothetical protein